MIVSHSYANSQLAGFGGTWEDWCDGKFSNDPTNLGKCKAWSVFPPWTDAGALMRGIPKSGSILPQPPVEPDYTPPGYTPGGVAAKSSGLLYVGLGVAALGILAVVAGRK